MIVRRNRTRAGAEPKAWRCVCESCGWACGFATEMFKHCWVEHGRRLSDAERTPRLESPAAVEA